MITRRWRRSRAWRHGHALAQDRQAEQQAALVAHLRLGVGLFITGPSNNEPDRLGLFIGKEIGAGGPDAGLSSGALRAPELGQASRSPARSARRLARRMFVVFVTFF